MKEWHGGHLSGSRGGRKKSGGGGDTGFNSDGQRTGHGPNRRTCVPIEAGKPGRRGMVAGCRRVVASGLTQNIAQLPRGGASYFSAGGGMAAAPPHRAASRDHALDSGASRGARNIDGGDA